MWPRLRPNRKVRHIDEKDSAHLSAMAAFARNRWCAICAAAADDHLRTFLHGEFLNFV